MTTQQAHSTHKIDRIFGSLATMQRHIRDYLWEEMFSLRVIRLKNPDDTTSYNELLSLFELRDQLTIGTIFDDDDSEGYKKLTYKIYSAFLYNLKRAEGFENPITSEFQTGGEAPEDLRTMTPEELYEAILQEWRLFDEQSV